MQQQVVKSQAQQVPQVKPKTQKNITDELIERIGELQNQGLVIPQDYAPQNALKSAFYEMINSPSGNLLEKCDRNSIANTLLDMVVQGLNPGMKQCYLFPYGNKLKLTRSYFGTVAVAKRIANVDVRTIVVYEGDDFETEILNGVERVAWHKSSWKNRDNPISGVYSIVTESNGREHLTVMTRKEIDKAWEMSNSKEKTVHKNFPQEMTKRTSINRALKMFVNTGANHPIIVDAFNRTTENEYEEKTPNIIEQVERVQDQQVEYTETIDFDIEETQKEQVTEF